MNDSWGYSAGDYNWKSTLQLIQNLVSCISGNGNFLLNVGPKPDGSMPEPSVKRLKEIGKWMKSNGESIYGAGRSPIHRQSVGLVTAKNKTAYLHAFHWIGKEICVGEIKSKVNSAYILSTGKKIKVKQEGERLFLYGLPKNPPDKYDTVIVMKMD
jgi:alpha-L-fucosidase